jgi:hypothetical protein
MLAIGIGHSRQPHARHFRKDASVVRAHDADADHPNTQLWARV